MYLEVAIHTLIVYSFLVLAMRLLGRRTLSQLAPLDLVILLLLGSSVETAMVLASTSLKVGIVSAVTLLVANWVFTRLMLKSKWFRHYVNGGPVLLVHDGVLQEERMRKVGLTVADLTAALRARECGSLADVRFAVLEPDGRINIVRRNAAVVRSETSLSSGQAIC